MISVIIPAYNEGERLPPYVRELVQEGLRQPSPVVELIVSDDGSTPAHAGQQRACVAAAQATLSQAESLHRIIYVAAERNAGKGSAIRRGWCNGSPESTWLAFLDADGSIGAKEFFRLAKLVATSSDVDIVTGARVALAGRLVTRSSVRHLQGRLFAAFAALQLQLHSYDPQCGVKFFRASLLRPLLPVLREERWLLDVELLTLMKRHGARALEVPIDWAEVGGSKLMPVQDALKMLWGVTRLKRRLERLPHVAATPAPSEAPVSSPMRDDEHVVSTATR